MSLHSPGPWQWDEEDGRISNADGCVAYVHGYGNTRTILKRGEEYSHADARLIVAAPEMYDELRFLIESHSRACRCRTCDFIARLAQVGPR